ncbi:MAG: DUF2723 domain-containing protein [bacterium]
MGKKNRGQKTDNRKQKKGKWKVPFKIPRFLIPKDELIIPQSFTVIDYVVGFLLFLISLQVYLKTLTPTLPFGDSGNFITCAYTLGITQPTGYPTYLMIGHLFTYLPLGNIAYRINLISAVAAALACMILYLLLLKFQSFRPYKQDRKDSLVVHYTPPVVAALLLAVSSTFWSQAVVTEVYTLNALFLLSMVLLLVIWRERIINYNSQINSKVNLPLYLFAFVCGVSFTHQLSTIFIIPAAIFWILITDKKIFLEYKRLGLLILLFLIGLLPYLYLPIRASMEAEPAWRDTSTLSEIINHITGKEFQDRMTFLSVNEFKEIKEWVFHLVNIVKLKEYFNLFIKQFTIYIWWIGIIGLWILFKNNFKLLLLLVLIFIADVLYSINYQIFDIEVYYIPSFVIWAVFIGCGIKGIINLVKVVRGKSSFIKIGGSYILCTLFLFSPIIAYSQNYYQNNKSRYYFAYDFAQNILRQLPEKSILIAQAEPDILTTWYHRYIEKAREDVAIVRVYNLNEAWYISEIKNRYPWLKIELNEEPVKGLYSHYQPIFKRILNDNIDSFSIYFVFKDALITNVGIEKGYSIEEGILSKCLKEKTEVINTLKNPNYIYRGIFDKEIYKDFWAKVAIRRYGIDYNDRGREYFRVKKYIDAEASFKMAINLIPEGIEYYYNLGLVYFNQKRYDLAIKTFQKALKLDSKYINAYKSIGNIYEKLGNIKEAINNYKKVVEIDTQDIKMHNALARVYYKDGMLDKVIEECKEIIRIDPNNIEAYEDLGSIYYIKRMYKHAVVVFNYLLKLDPDNSYAEQMLEIIKNKK